MLVPQLIRAKRTMERTKGRRKANAVKKHHHQQQPEEEEEEEEEESLIHNCTMINIQFISSDRTFNARVVNSCNTKHKH